MPALICPCPQTIDHTFLLFVLLISVTALIDLHLENDISFGFLYLFPMLIIGASLNPPSFPVRLRTPCHQKGTGRFEEGLNKK
jgi:hypothetical protein